MTPDTIATPEFESCALAEKSEFEAVATYETGKPAGRSQCGAERAADALLEASPHPLVTIDLSGRVTLWNGAAQEMFGWNSDEVLGQPCPLMPRDQREHMEQNIDRIKEDSKGIEIQLNCLRKMDSPLDAVLSLSPIRDAHGSVAGVLIFAVDNSKVTTMEDALRGSDIRYRELFNSMANAVAVFEPREDGADFMIKDFNRAAEVLDKHHKMDVLGRSVRAILPAVEENGLFGALLRVHRTGEPEYFPVAWREDGRIVGHREFYIYRLPSGEIVSIYADVTVSKQAEEALRGSNLGLQELNQKLADQNSKLVQSEKMASIGQLAAGVAHEINNPVGYVMSNLGTLKEYMGTIRELLAEYGKLADAAASGDETARAETIAKIEELKAEEDLEFVLEDIGQLLAESIEGTERVRDIVMNLKSFARVDDARAREADINECLESTLKVVWNELKYKCKVEKDLQPAPMIRCFPGQLNQVFTNLLVNAAQAIEEMGVVTVETRLADDRIVISIADDGVGIPAENAAKIFDPFFTTKPVGKGTGLGLAIVHGIIERHQGTIGLQSEVGQGTVFTISLPVDCEPEEDEGE